MCGDGGNDVGALKQVAMMAVVAVVVAAAVVVVAKKHFDVGALKQVRC